MLCPNCGHTARPVPSHREARCGHCNVKLPENSRPQAAPEDSGLIACWNCAHANPASAERCAHCNARVSAAPAVKSAPENRFTFTQHTASHDE